MPVYVFVKIIIISLLQLPPSEDVYFTFALSHKILFPVLSNLSIYGIFLTNCERNEVSKKQKTKI